MPTFLLKRWVFHRNGMDAECGRAYLSIWTELGAQRCKKSPCFQDRLVRAQASDWYYG